MGTISLSDCFVCRMLGENYRQTIIHSYKNTIKHTTYHCDPGLTLRKEVHTSVGKTHWFHVFWTINVDEQSDRDVCSHHHATKEIWIEFTCKSQRFVRLQVSCVTVNTFSVKMFISNNFLNCVARFHLMSPEYTFQYRGLLYLPWKTHAEVIHNNQNQLMFSTQCKDSKKLNE